MRPSSAAIIALLSLSLFLSLSRSQALSLAAPLRLAGTDNKVQVGEVVRQLSELQANITKEGEKAQQAYERWEEQVKNLTDKINTATSRVKALNTTVAKVEAANKVIHEWITNLTARIAKDEGELTRATRIRAIEAERFKVETSTMNHTISLLERTIAYLECKYGNGSTSLRQTRKVQSLAHSLATIVQAPVASTTSTTDDAPVQQAAKDAYVSVGPGLLTKLTEVLNKTKSDLNSTLKSEASSVHAFQKLKQSLTTAIKSAEEALSKARSGLVDISEEKRNLTLAKRDLAKDVEEKAELNSSNKAKDLEAEMKSRGEEIQALGKAKEITNTCTGGAHELDLTPLPEADLQKGLECLHAADKVLKEYYAKDTAHKKAEAEGKIIINMLLEIEAKVQARLAQKQAEELAKKKAEAERQAAEVARQEQAAQQQADQDDQDDQNDYGSDSDYDDY
mmetsp:Transcript_91717/g.230478  ORF Transcript_91717/g.230478 Transcript_91717/m.230478 type:complete len:452 (+) Transcript_91717:67-1422(+)